MSLEKLTLYELLDVAPDASQAEIQKAYLLGVNTYQKSSLPIYGLIFQEERQVMLDRLENAFAVLSDPVRRRQYNTSIGLSWHQIQMDRLPPSTVEKPTLEETNLWSKATSRLGHRQTPHQTPQEVPAVPREFQSFDYSLSTGRYLKSVRKLKGLTLQGIVDVTKISQHYLEALESEQYERLPGGAYVTYMLGAYAKSLNLNAETVIEDFRSMQSR